MKGRAVSQEHAPGESLKGLIPSFLLSEGQNTSQTAADCRAAQLALLPAPAGMQGATPALGEGGGKKTECS